MDDASPKRLSLPTSSAHKKGSSLKKPRERYFILSIADKTRMAEPMIRKVLTAARTHAQPTARLHITWQIDTRFGSSNHRVII